MYSNKFLVLISFAILDRPNLSGLRVTLVDVIDHVEKNEELAISGRR